MVFMTHLQKKGNCLKTVRMSFMNETNTEDKQREAKLTAAVVALPENLRVRWEVEYTEVEYTISIFFFFCSTKLCVSERVRQVMHFCFVLHLAFATFRT